MKGNIFTQVNLDKVRSSTFNLSHDRKMSMKMGELTPILCMDTLPGDNFSIKTSKMLRFAPMVAPVMHRVNAYLHYFFVPHRILWDNFEDFITGGEDGLDTSVWPRVDVDCEALQPGSLGDYMGLPTDMTGATTVSVSVVPFAAYIRIYNDYYRDQNLQPDATPDLIDGTQTDPFWAGGIAGTPLRRAWQHDYFTSALPWTQKGPEATIPLGTSAPLVFDEGQVAGHVAYRLDGTTQPATGDMQLQGGTGGFRAINDSAGNPINLDITTGTTVDLSSATAAGIIDLRRAFKLQEWLEKNARGGSRYFESNLIHFNVTSPDARLQRPEYLGGGACSIQFSEVLQTSANASEPTPQGNMAGHGISVDSNKTIKYYCKEHGYIIGIMSILPKTGYFQGIPKHFIKYDKLDFGWPSFAHIGEQPIFNAEIFIDGSMADNQTFGYIPRYAEYKFWPSSVHGEMRTTLDFWHLARKFSTRPQLNNDFIVCDPDDRIFAVQDAEQVYALVLNQVYARRKLPFFGNPRM